MGYQGGKRYLTQLRFIHNGHPVDGTRVGVSSLWANLFFNGQGELALTHPLVHHPLDANYNSVVSEPQLS
jgi:hypothetical protein